MFWKALQFMKLTFYINSSIVSHHRSITTDYTVTRDYNQYGVFGKGSGYCTYHFGITIRLSDLDIGQGGIIGNTANQLPYLDLKICSLQTNGKAEFSSLDLKKFVYLLNYFLHQYRGRRNIFLDLIDKKIRVT